MKNKINISFYCRKPDPKYHYSIENFYKNLIKNNNQFNFKIKQLPFYSKGVINRLLNIFWSVFHQSEINHITGDINYIAFFLKKKKTILTILDLYSLKRLQGIQKFLYYLLWVWLPIQRSKKILTISNSIKNEILNKFNVSPNKVAVIPCAVSNLFRKSNFKKKNNKFLTALIVGTSENKNFYRSILAIKNLNIRLNILGYLDKNQINLLRKYDIKYKNYLNIDQHMVVQIYLNSSFLLFPSLYEGFGIPIIEAQSIGIPVITSNMSPMRDISKLNSFYLVDPSNTQDIRNKIINLKNKFKINKEIIIKNRINSDKYLMLKIQSNYNKFYTNFYESINRNQ